jgi:hypothetical protein
MSTAYLIPFNGPDHPFCEFYVYNKAPEYVNAATSLMLVYYGLKGLVFFHGTQNQRMLYMAFLVNGMTSCMYHSTNWIGWGLMDRFSMVLIAWNCYMLFLDVLRAHTRLWSFVFDWLRFLLTMYMTAILTIAGLHNEPLFDTMFGVFLGSLVFVLGVVSCMPRRFPLSVTLLKGGWKGVGYIGIAGAFWILTEKWCHSYATLKYAMGHAVWHVGVSYGGFLVSQIPLSLLNEHD